MRWLGGFFIFFSCLTLGFTYSNSKRSHLKSLADVCDALELIKGELSTNLSSLPEICEALDGRAKGSAADFLLKLRISFENLGTEDFSMLWTRAVESAFKDLSCEELKSVASLGNILGKFRLEDQLSALDCTTAYLKDTLNRAKLDYPNERKLSLGVSAAGAMLILLTLI